MAAGAIAQGVGATVGAVGSYMGARAERKGAQQSRDLQLDQMNKYDPYMQGGAEMYGQYQDALTGNPGAAFQAYMDNPAVNFQRQQGMNAIEGSAAARGGLFSGQAMKGLQEYGQNLASTQYQSYLDRLMQGASMGQNALNSQSNVMQGAATAMQNVGRAKGAQWMGPSSQIAQGIGSATGQGMFSGGGGGAGGASADTQAAFNVPSVMG